ncbi:hypothetical protein J3R74_002484 [Puniceicoccus vermicola]
MPGSRLKSTDPPRNFDLRTVKSSLMTIRAFPERQKRHNACRLLTEPTKTATMNDVKSINRPLDQNRGFRSAPLFLYP